MILTRDEVHQSRSRSDVKHLTTLVLALSCTCEAYKFSTESIEARVCPHIIDALKNLAEGLSAIQDAIRP